MAGVIDGVDNSDTVGDLGVEGVVEGVDEKREG